MVELQDEREVVPVAAGVDETNVVVLDLMGVLRDATGERGVEMPVAEALVLPRTWSEWRPFVIDEKDSSSLSLRYACTPAWMNSPASSKSSMSFVSVVSSFSMTLRAIRLPEPCACGNGAYALLSVRMVTMQETGG